MTAEVVTRAPTDDYHSAADASGLASTQLLLERILSWQASAPTRVLLQRVDATARGELSATPFTTTQVIDAARACAARLAREGIAANDRVLLCLPNTERFLEWFLGVHWLGAIPVPLPSLSAFAGKSSLVERVRGVMSDCRPRAVVADAGTCRGLRALCGETRPEPALLDDDAVRAEGDAEAAAFVRPPHRLAPGDTAFIQYTSGSTGTPRGVIVTQENLRSNLWATGQRARCTADDRLLSWLPVYHDMGLIGGLLFPLYDGHTCYLMSPVAFLARPSNWLLAISRFRATISLAPNFAYSLCLRKVRDADLAGVDLSAWRLTLNGAEPIEPASAVGFGERFGKLGFSTSTMYPVYGLAEATVAVTFPDPGEPVRVDVVDRAAISRGEALPCAPGPGAASFVSVGHAVPGHTVEIREPDGEAVLGERRLGEIVVEGPSVSPGYFSLSGPPATPWKVLRTGDIGYVANGNLYVVDRYKDLIISAGRNLSPADLERSAHVPGVRPGRAVAFGVLDAETGTEAVIVVAETAARGAPRLESIRADVEKAVRIAHGIAPKEVALVEPGTLPRTSSGKVMRRKTRDLYREGTLVPAGSTSPVGRLLKKVRLWFLARRLLSQR